MRVHCRRPGPGATVLSGQSCLDLKFEPFGTERELSQFAAFPQYPTAAD
jgi:hypothetical protein